MYDVDMIVCAFVHFASIRNHSKEDYFLSYTAPFGLNVTLCNLIFSNQELKSSFLKRTKKIHVVRIEAGL